MGKYKKILAISIWSVFLATQAIAQAPEPLDPSGYRHLTFKDIPETSYIRSGNGLGVTVRKSASFLYKPFGKIREVTEVSCRWRVTSSRLVPDGPVEMRKSKAGDDFLLRIGMLVSGSAPSIPFFAPAWIKSVREFALLPSERLTYLVAGGSIPGGTRWTSPYSSSIENIVFSDTVSTDGWHVSKHIFSGPQKIVGLWIMSDGDNTGADFAIELEQLILK